MAWHLILITKYGFSSTIEFSNHKQHVEILIHFFLEREI